MVHNRDAYIAMGAKLPKGILLFGEPGLGKSLMVKCFIKECKLPCYTARRESTKDFVKVITETFDQAKRKAPSILFLDDIDKFVNEDERRVYVASKYLWC